MEQKRRALLILILLVCLATGLLTLLFWPFLRDLNDPAYREAFSAWVKALGLPGAAVVLGLQILQIIVAVIPGGPVELIAGAAYGAPGGLGICVAGCLAASSAVFVVSRRFGLPLAARFFGPEALKPWAFLWDSRRSALLVFVVFLIPGTPKDMLTWLAPLSGLSLPVFLVVSTVARVPAMLCAAIMGAAVIEGDGVLFLIIFLVTALAGLAGLWCGARLRRGVPFGKNFFLKKTSRGLDTSGKKE